MDIIKRVTKDAERLLKSLNASYYIKLPTGTEVSHGLEGFELTEKSKAQAAPKEKKPRIAKHGKEFGALVAYYRPYLDKCKVAGDIAEIPFGEFTPDHLRGAVAAFCSHEWGKNTYITTINRVKAQVEVMRTAEPAKESTRVTSESKVNGQSKFHTVGHGLDALQTLKFDDEQDVTTQR